MNLFMAMDFMFEPFKELVKEKYGEEFAKQVYSSKSEYMIDNTTILSDEDLKKSGLYEKYSKYSIIYVLKFIVYSWKPQFSLARAYPILFVRRFCKTYKN